MILCIDIGGTMIKSAIVKDQNNDVTIFEKREFPTQAKIIKGVGILSKVISLIREYQKKFTLQGVAISTAGVVDPNTFAVIYANKNIPEYIGTNFAQVIEKEFHLPCIVENDVNAATMGEWCFGAGERCDVLLCLTVGTGIGGGLIINRSLYRGTSNSAAEIGYMKIKDSTLEELASTTTLINRVKQRTGLLYDGKQIFDLAKSGHDICREEIDRIVSNLCVGLANCIYLVNPARIVLGGGIMMQRDYLQPIIDKYLSANLEKEFIKNVTITFAKLGNDAGMVGAFAIWKEKKGEIFSES